MAQTTEPNPMDSNGDGVSDNSPDVSFYVGLGQDVWGGSDPDPHAVHGIEISTGGLVVVGKYAASSSYTGGFISGMPTLASNLGNGYHGMIDKSDVWMYKFGSVGTGGETPSNGMNQVVEIGSFVFAVGFKAATSSRIDSYIVKLNKVTGVKVWDMTIVANNDKTSALEGIEATSDGGIICSGLTNADNVNCIEGYKSYGNPVCGTAQLMYFNSALVDANTAPSNPTWTQTYNGLVSGKSVREIPGGGGYVFVASAVDPEGVATIIKTNTAGVKVWETQHVNHGEVTDVSVVQSDNDSKTYFMITGHGGNGDYIHGRLSKIDSDNGSAIWTKSYGEVIGGKAQFVGIVDGNPNNWIYHECWGIANAPDEQSVILGCGTGIEDCRNRPSACNSDPRVKWRSLLLGVAIEDGQVLWHRMDSFEDNKASGNVEDSASEYAFLTKDGAIFSTNDEGFGVGLLMTEPIGSPSPTPPSPMPPSNTPPSNTPPSPTPPSPTSPSTCFDNPETEFDGKGCSWVYQKKKRCKIMIDDGVKAEFACPIACKNSKKCTIPKCLKNSLWKPQSGNFKNCASIKKMNKKEKKKACREIGTDGKTFGYAACRKCGRCGK